MGETHQQQQSSRLGLLKGGGGGGEIVEVQGGHIVRSTGRKDRHSKVCTAKGPRDRRVRLSANTAIQFYDVQDRLGYDRPSKAVDWLINKAKSAIDKLAELPPWKPTATTNTTSSQPSEQNQDEEEEQNQNEMGVGKRGGGGDLVSSRYGYEHQHSLNNNNPNNSSSGFLPPSLDSDSIADTIKSFFPTVATTSSSPIHFQNYPPDLLSRTSSQTQDLRLSLHSFQDPILLHHHSNQEPHFPISAPMSFDPNTSNNNTWSDQQSSEMSRFQRMVAWNTGGDSSSGGGFVFNSQPLSQPLLGQNPFFQQRGPLQSINSPQIRVWSDPNAVGNHYQLPTLHPSPISGIGYTSGGFSGFRVPARIQGDEEHDPASNKPSSASRH